MRNAIKKPSQELTDCHKPKPILLPTGEVCIGLRLKVNKRVRAETCFGSIKNTPFTQGEWGAAVFKSGCYNQSADRQSRLNGSTPK